MSRRGPVGGLGEQLGLGGRQRPGQGTSKAQGTGEALEARKDPILADAWGGGGGRVGKRGHRDQLGNHWSR